MYDNKPKWHGQALTHLYTYVYNNKLGGMGKHPPHSKIGKIQLAMSSSVGWYRSAVSIPALLTKQPFLLRSGHNPKTPGGKALTIRKSTNAPMMKTIKISNPQSSGAFRPKRDPISKQDWQLQRNDAQGGPLAYKQLNLYPAPPPSLSPPFLPLKRIKGNFRKSMKSKPNGLDKCQGRQS